MADPNSPFYLDNLLSPEPVVPATPALVDTKKQTLEEMVQAKKLLLGGSQQADVAATALENKNNLANRNQVLLDAASLPPMDFQAKYGTDAQSLQNNLTGARDRLSGTNLESRDLSQIAGDSLNSVVQGVVNSGGGIAAGVAGILNDRAGAAISGFLGDVSEKMQGAQSNELNRKRSADAVAGALDRSDNAELFEEEKIDEGSVRAGLKRMARDFGDSIVNAASDPTLLSDGISQGVGSLLAAGPIAKAAKLGLKGILGAVGEKVVEAGAMPASIGLMEGGGAYSGANQEVMAMSYADLQKSSPYFNELLSAGSSPEEARLAVANRSGLIAGAIQGPIAAVTGAVTGTRLESAPFRVPSIRSAAGEILVREPVEEAIQSGTGQYATNVGIQQAADENRDVLDQVGSQAGTGALIGAGTAGSVQAPGAVLRSAANAVKGIAGSVIERGEAVEEANAKASPVAPETINAAVQTAVANAPIVLDDLVKVGAERARTPEAQQELTDFVGRVSATAQITPEEIASLPESIRRNVPETDNRFEALLAIAAVAANPQNTADDRISAGLFVRNQLRDNEAVFSSDLPTALKGLSEDRPEFQQFNDYKAVLDSINQHPEIKQVLQVINDADTMADVEEITPQTVSNAVGMASFNPAAVNPETNDRILLQSTEGGNDLSPIEKAALKASSSLVRAGRQYAETMQEMGQPIPDGIPLMQAVNKQIERKSDDPSKLSFSQHLAGIIEAKQTGNEKLARERAARFGKFARHMRNKLEAVNQSYGTGGQPQKFQALDASGNWFTSNGPSIHKGSGKLAQQIFAEAQYAAMLNNNIAETFPELGVQKIDVPTLVPTLRKPVDQAVQQVKATKQIPENRAQEAQRRIVEAPDVTDTVLPDAVESTEAVSKPNQEGSISEPAPVVSAVREEAKPEVSKEIKEPVQRVEQEEAEAVRDTSGTETVAEPVEEAVLPFESLIQIGKTKNKFVEAFKLPAEKSSRLVGEESPLNYLNDVLKNESTLDEVVTERNYSFDKKISRKFREYVSFSPAIVVAMNERLRNFINKTTKYNKKEITYGQMIKDGVSINTWVIGRALNILDGDNNYNQELLQQAVAAGLHWALNAEKTSYPKDAEEISKILNIDEAEVTIDQIMNFNRGLSTRDAKRSLADTIQKFWGVQANKDTPDGYVKGIPEAIAAELLYGLQDVGLIVLDNSLEVPVFEDGILKNKPYPRVLFDARPDEINELMDTLNLAPSVIADVALVENEDVLHIGKAPSKPADTQMRNPLVRNTAQQRKAITAAQNTPFYPNTMVLDFLRSLGEKAVIELFGGTDLEGKVLNVNHERSIKGKNLGLQNSYRNIIRQIGQVTNYASTQGTAVTDTPTYYEHNVSRVGRLHMQGPSNPQSDKMARESFMSTRTTLDMNNPTDVSKFWMTIAQAVGVKTEKETRAVAIQKAQEFIGKAESFMPAVRAFVQDGTPMSQETLDSIKALFKAEKKDLSFKAMHALLAVAKLDSTPADQLGSFEHFLSLEADGKTDGPINALVHFTAGFFSPEWLKNVAKGGLYFGVRGKTLNAHQAEDAADLYEDAKGRLVIKQADFRNMLGATSPDAARQSDALFSVMNALSADVTFDPKSGQLELSRGVTKNPLTITIYGSGINGIAAKVAMALVDTFYEQISDVIANGGSLDPKLVENLNALTDNYVVLNKKENRYEVIKSASTNRKGELKDFTFTTKQLQNFRDNVKILFVNQMNDSIHEMMGESMKTTQKAQKAIQVQSIVLKHIFEAEVKARMKELGRKNNEFLSQNELAKIYKDLRQYSPVIETGTQTLFVGGKDRNDIVGAPFATSLTEDLATDAYMFAPANASVSGAPYMVISTGDGQMVQNILTQRDPVTGALMVFDGVEMKASTIDEDSLKINEAVFDGWMGNPVRNVSDSFRAFLRENPFEVLQDAERTAMEDEIKKSLYGPAASGKEWAEAMAEITALNEALVDDANSIQARHETMEAVELSIDHMASAEQAYTNDGEMLPVEQSAMVQRLNEIYAEKLAKITRLKSVVEAPSKAYTEKLNSVGSIDADSGARVIRSSELRSVLEGDFSNGILDAVTDYRIVSGSPSDIAAYENANDPENYDPNKSFFGKINATKKVIYITNPTQETLLHELIHAATFDKVAAHYDGAVSNPEDSAAIIRLEGLMKEWLGQSYENESSSALEARQLAYSAVAEFWNRGQKAEALNEFMAWSLSNQHIAAVQQKTKVKNPLYRVLGEALKLLKKLVGMNVDDTLFSNIRFNTQVLLKTPNTFRNSALDVIMHQSANFGNDDRMTSLRERFFNKIMAAIDKVPNQVEKIHLGNEARLALGQAENVSNEFMARGFAMNMQQASTFQMIAAAFATEAELNPASLARIQEVYASVIKKMTVESFMNNPELDDPNDRYNAQEKFNALNGVFFTKTDKKGRSSLLPSFLALAMVDDSFRSILAKLDVPKSERDESGTWDARLSNLGDSMMDNLSTYMSGEGRKAPNVKAALDALVDNLIEKTGEQRTFIEQFSEKTVSGFDGWVRDQLQNLSGKVDQKAIAVLNNSQNKFVRASARVAQLMASIVNNETTEHVASGVTSALNQMSIWTPLREITAEIFGRSKENASVFDMISLVRSAVQQARQQFREHLPTKIAAHFTRVLTDDEWSHLFKGLGKTDIASLRKSYDMETVLNLLHDSNNIKVLTAQIEADLQVSEGALFGKIRSNAQNLAQYMNTGKAGSNPLRNAFAVSNLFGAGGRKTAATQQTIDKVDHLISLYALQGLDADTKATLKDFAISQKDGMNFALSYLVGQRSDEQAKLTTGAARANHYKGYIPSENQVGTSLIVTDDSEYARLVSMGYTRVSDYIGSKAEGRGTKRGYYHAPVSGRATFNQGVLQAVHNTASGVDPRNGRTVQDLTAGSITNPDEVKRIAQRMAYNTNTDEALMPIWDENGEVIAFERSIDPAQMGRMNRNTHLGQMIGAWRGRQVEEALATDFNKQLIDNLGTIWNEQKAKRSDEFVNLANLTKKDDPVLHDAWGLVAPDTRKYIEEVFGADGFQVRKDMLNDAIGFRSASVGDAWSGNTRWKPAVQEAFRKAAMAAFKNDAYRYMVNAEKLAQNLVSDAKVLIVVKSVVVPVSNILSNAYQLSMRGVPVRSIVKGFGSKTTEINQYIKNRDRQIELEADLRAADGNLVKTRKIQTELQSIQDSNRRMSIWSLIEAGEFSSISDGGVTQEDLALSEGRFVDLMERAVSKLPDGVKTFGRYALVTKDTPLFKGLARAVQYGDFLAKAVLYEDLIQRQKLGKAEALAQVSEEFVNYNRLAGRTRNYLESVGLLWFWNFKLRSIKVAASMIRNNPVRAFFGMVAQPTLPIIGTIGSPVTDNFLTITAEGKLGHSIGPGMGLNAWTLNPYVNAFK